MKASDAGSGGDSSADDDSDDDDDRVNAEEKHDEVCFQLCLYNH